MYIALYDLKKGPTFNKKYNVQIKKIGDIFAVQEEPDQPQDPVSALNKASIKPFVVEK
jgi:hypothetical protein